MQDVQNGTDWQARLYIIRNSELNCAQEKAGRDRDWLLVRGHDIREMACMHVRAYVRM